MPLIKQALITLGLVGYAFVALHVLVFVALFSVYILEQLFS